MTQNSKITGAQPPCTTTQYSPSTQPAAFASGTSRREATAPARMQEAHPRNSRVLSDEERVIRRERRQGMYFGPPSPPRVLLRTRSISAPAPLPTATYGQNAESFAPQRLSQTGANPLNPGFNHLGEPVSHFSDASSVRTSTSLATSYDFFEHRISHFSDWSSSANTTGSDRISHQGLTPQSTQEFSELGHGPYFATREFQGTPAQGEFVYRASPVTDFSALGFLPDAASSAHLEHRTPGDDASGATTPLVTPHAPVLPTAAQFADARSNWPERAPMDFGWRHRERDIFAQGQDTHTEFQSTNSNRLLPTTGLNSLPRSGTMGPQFGGFNDAFRG